MQRLLNEINLLNPSPRIRAVASENIGGGFDILHCGIGEFGRPRLAHNQETASSNLAPATEDKECINLYRTTNAREIRKHCKLPRVLKVHGLIYSFFVHLTKSLRKALWGLLYLRPVAMGQTILTGA